MLLRGDKSPLVGSDYEGQSKLQEWRSGGNMRWGVELIRLGRIPGLKRETWGTRICSRSPVPKSEGPGAPGVVWKPYRDRGTPPRLEATAGPSTSLCFGRDDNVLGASLT